MTTAQLLLYVLPKEKRQIENATLTNQSRPFQLNPWSCHTTIRTVINPTQGHELQ